MDELRIFAPVFRDLKLTNCFSTIGVQHTLKRGFNAGAKHTFQRIYSRLGFFVHGQKPSIRSFRSGKNQLGHYAHKDHQQEIL